MEVDASQQHYGAVGIWRKITYTYADGCQIVLEGEGYESKGKMPYIGGPKGRVYKDSECTILDMMDKLAEFPDSEPQSTNFLDCIYIRKKFALDELNGHHSCVLASMTIVVSRLNHKRLALDPKTQLSIGDDTASALVNQPTRKGWDF